MEYKIILILLVLGAAIFSGCVDNPGKTVYFSEKYNETITLYADHTATAITSKDSASGTWRVDNSKLIITWLPFGSVHIFDLYETKIVDKDGDVWVKK